MYVHTDRETFETQFIRLTQKSQPKNITHHASKHFKQKYTEGPPVNSFCVRSIHDDLHCNNTDMSL